MKLSKKIQGKQGLVRDIERFEKPRVWEIGIPLYFRAQLLHFGDNRSFNNFQIFSSISFHFISPLSRLTLTNPQELKFEFHLRSLPCAFSRQLAFALVAVFSAAISC